MSSSNGSTDGFFGWPWPMQWPLQGGGVPFNLAPQQLNQPINPGWSFGNVTVNTTNSSAPQVEQEVVSQHSYGRQIGRLFDAVEVLVKALPPAKQDEPRLKSFLELAQAVQDIKRASRATRLARLREELQALKAEDPAAWKTLLAGR